LSAGEECIQFLVHVVSFECFGADEEYEYLCVTDRLEQCRFPFPSGVEAITIKKHIEEL